MQSMFLKKKYTIFRFIHLLTISINIFVLLLTQTSNFDVFADNDSEFILIDDFYTYNAYKWWSLYGLTADTETSYTNTLNSISQSSESGTFSFSGNFSGSFDASVSLTYSGTTQTGSQGNTFWSTTSESGLMYDSSYQGIEMTITPSANGASNDYNATYACVYNTQSTSTAAVMTCTPDYSTYSTSLTLPNQSITIDEIRFNTAGSIQTDLFLSLLNQGTEVGSLNGTLGMSGGGTGSLSLTENGTTTTTSVNTNSLKYTLPLMTGTIDNSWSRYDFRDQKPKAFRMIPNREDDPTTLIFLVSGRMTKLYDEWIKVYGVTASDYNTQYTLKRKHTQSRQIGAFQLVTLSIYTEDLPYANDSYIHLKFYPENFNTYNTFLPIIPLFVGNYSRIPDDLYRFAYGGDRTIDAINSFHSDMVEGTSTSQSAASGIDNSTSSFSSTSGQLVQFEDSSFNSLDSAINDVQLNSNILSGQGFLNAANWVRVQFDNLISYSPIQSVVVFSLSLGFALLIIGKVR